VKRTKLGEFEELVSLNLIKKKAYPMINIFGLGLGASKAATFKKLH
jgi:hypothetical protein